MSATFQNSAMVLSIGVFFTLIILGLAGTLPGALNHGLIAQGVPHADAARIAALPPVSIMFAALLGYNPVQTLLGPAISKLSASHAAYLTGHTFFPSLISAPVPAGPRGRVRLRIAACVIAAVASLLRGGKYVHDDSSPALTAELADADIEAGLDVEQPRRCRPSRRDPRHPAPTGPACRGRSRRRLPGTHISPGRPRPDRKDEPGCGRSRHDLPGRLRPGSSSSPGHAVPPLR